MWKEQEHIIYELTLHFFFCWCLCEQVIMAGIQTDERLGRKKARRDRKWRSHY
jgi:hypothetical protein